MLHWRKWKKVRKRKKIGSGERGGARVERLTIARKSGLILEVQRNLSNCICLFFLFFVFLMKECFFLNRRKCEFGLNKFRSQCDPWNLSEINLVSGKIRTITFFISIN